MTSITNEFRTLVRWYRHLLKVKNRKITIRGVSYVATIKTGASTYFFKIESGKIARRVVTGPFRIDGIFELER